MNFKKSWLVIVSIMLLLVMLLTACGGQEAAIEDAVTTEAEAGATQESVAEEAAVEESVEMPSYKIGVMMYTLSNQWAQDIIASLEYLGEHFNCEFEFVEAGTPDLYMSTIENLCESGIDGFLTLHSGKMTQQMLEVCESYGVYMVVSQNNVSADNGFEDFSVNSEYFCGYVYEDDYQTAYDIASDMIAKGATNFGIHSLPLGIAAQMDDRVNGATDAIVAGGGTVVGEARSFSQGEAAQNLISQFSEIDAIFTTVSGVDNVVQPLISAGKAVDTLLNSYESGSGVKTALEEGTVQYAIAGQNADTMISFVLLYNAMNGTQLKPADGSAAAILMNYVVLTTAEEYSEFEEYIVGEVPAYSGEELKAHTSLLNEDATFEALKEAAEAFSLEEVKTRR